MIRGGADIYVRRSQQYAKGLKRIGLNFRTPLKRVRPALGGGPAAREPGLGTGRGGDVTGSANSSF